MGLFLENLPVFKTLKELRGYFDPILRDSPRVFVRGKGSWTREICWVSFFLSPEIKDYETWSNFDLGWAQKRLEYVMTKASYPLINVAEELKRDPTSRRSYMLEVDFNPTGPPCNIVHQFMVREGETCICTYLRSSDYWNILPLDIYTASEFLKRISGDIKRRSGGLVFFINSLHVYEKDWAEMSKEMAAQHHLLESIQEI